MLADLHDLPGDAFIVDKKRGDKIDEHAVEIIIGHYGIHAGAVMIGRAGGQHIYRVVYRSFGIKGTGQQLAGFFRKWWQRETGGNHDVGGDNRRTTCICDDAYPVTPGNRLGGKAGGSLDQFSFIAK